MATPINDPAAVCSLGLKVGALLGLGYISLYREDLDVAFKALDQSGNNAPMGMGLMPSV